ncbi:MAG TPA: hypothetical protein VE693_05185 [Gaiellaceae bacterium]|nr:hypothetical protein [Gaiellaceae bacterium]
MKRFFLFSGAVVVLFVLAATAAFASNGRSGAVHGKSAQATHGKSGAAQAATNGAANAEVATTTTAHGKAATHSKAATHAHGGAAVQQTEDRGKSAEAQHHVILCHRTGSDSNPYVVINVSVRAWEHGHTTHPAKDGRDDILLKDPAQPGEKMDESLCPAEAGGVSPGGGGEVGGGQTGGETGGQVSGGGVAGAHVAANVRSSSGGGVAGAVSAANQTLPFTGMPLWIVFAAGLGLLTSGLVLRRLSRGTR